MTSQRKGLFGWFRRGDRAPKGQQAYRAHLVSQYGFATVTQDALTEMFVPPLVRPTLETRQNLIASYRAPRALSAYLKAEAGEPLVLLGSAGSGKTTLLRHLAITGEGTHFLLDAAHCDGALLDAIQHTLPAELEHDWLDGALPQAIYLIDGFDHIADLARRQAITQWIATQQADYPQARFLLASRPMAYQATPLATTFVFELRPFEADEVTQLLQQYGSEITTQERNPLKLAMMAYLARQGENVPASEVALFEAFTARQPDADYASLQAYRAALAAKDDAAFEPQAHIEDDTQHEMLRFHAALTEATPIIEAYLAATSVDEEPDQEAEEEPDQEAAEPPAREPSPAMQTLLTQCLQTPDIAIEKRQLALIKGRVTQFTSDNPYLARQQAEALLAIRLRRLRAPDKAVSIDSSMVTQAEYHLFVADQRVEGAYYQPDHWLEFAPPKGKHLEPLGGVRAVDAVAFCRWLTIKAADGGRYRLPSEAELRRVQDLMVEQGTWLLSGEEGPQFGGIPSYRSSGLARSYPAAVNNTFSMDRTRSFRSERAQRLAEALGLAADFRYPFDQARAKASTNVTARARHRKFALYLEARRIAVLEQTHEIVSIYGRALDLSRAEALGRIRDLDKALNMLLSRDAEQLLAWTRHIDATWPEISDFLRWYVRLLSAGLVTQLMVKPQRKKQVELQLLGIEGSRDYDALERAIEQLIAHLIDLYVDLALLEARVEGKQTAFEGIRLARGGYF